MAKRSSRTLTGKAKRLPVSTKITPELRVLLQTAADTDGRTLGAEIEQRLLASFEPKVAAEDRMRVIAREEIERAQAGEFKKVFETHHTQLPNGQWAVDTVNGGGLILGQAPDAAMRQCYELNGKQ